jgi:hypothetical protein
MSKKNSWESGISPKIHESNRSGSIKTELGKQESSKSTEKGGGGTQDTGARHDKNQS